MGRSLKKGPYVDEKLYRKVEKQRAAAEECWRVDGRLSRHYSAAGIGVGIRFGVSVGIRFGTGHPE